MRGSNRSVLAAVAVVAAASLGFDLTVAAEISRCTDTSGKVSYTDKACPATAREAKQLDGVETNGTSILVPGTKSMPAAKVDSETTPPARVAEPSRNPVPTDNGLTIIDPRARVPRQGTSSRDSDRDDEYPYTYPYAGYPGYAGPYRHRSVQPQDLRPTLRNCDAGGCSDTMGNHYDRAGKVDRYVRPDGRTCRPVGTTVVC